MPDLHDVIRCDRRQYILLRPDALNTQIDQVSRMGVYHAMHFRVVVVDHAMQCQRLRRLGTGHPVASGIDLGNLRRIEITETSIGRCDQPAIIKTGTDVTGRAYCVATLKQTCTGATNFFTQLVLGADGARHAAPPASTRKAFSKKSTVPKLPDLSARASGSSSSVAVAGTPGSICGPMRNARTSSACTTAPEVSPPATTNWRTPRSRKPLPTSARACSTRWPAFATPSSFCTAFTSSGVAVA